MADHPEPKKTCRSFKGPKASQNSSRGFVWVDSTPSKPGPDSGHTEIKADPGMSWTGPPFSSSCPAWEGRREEGCLKSRPDTPESFYRDT